MSVLKLKCTDQTHAWLEDGRFLRIRCTGHRRCKDAKEARRLNGKAIHIWDLKTGERTTEIVPLEEE